LYRISQQRQEGHFILIKASMNPSSGLTHTHKTLTLPNHKAKTAGHKIIDWPKHNNIGLPQYPSLMNIEVIQEKRCFRITWCCSQMNLIDTGGIRPEQMQKTLSSQQIKESS
jgi:hypothetical protein